MPRPIVIATLLRAQSDTRVQTYFRTFADYLSKSDRPFALITPYSAPLWQVYPVVGLRMLVNLLSPSLGVWWYRYWHAFFLRQALKRHLKSATEYVIYAQCPLSALAALAARVPNRQRLVMVAHFNLSQADEWADKRSIKRGGRLYRSIQATEADVLPRLDGLVFVSDFMRRQLIGRIPAITGVPCRVVPNFLPDPGVTTSHGQPAANLISIGTMEPRKNQRYALEIVAAAKEMGQPLTLTLVGDGPDRAALEAQAQLLGIESHVQFAGYVKRGSARLTHARAYLHVARMENLPIVLIEAMSRGLPVFAPAVGGIPEVFEDGVEGRVIPLDDAEKAAKVLLEWMKWPDVLATAGKAARRRFIASFQDDTAAARLDQFLCQSVTA